MGYRETAKEDFTRGSQPTQGEYYEWMDNTWFKDETIPVANVNIGEQALTPAASVNWDFDNGNNATLVIDQNSTLSISNMAVGMFGILVITQDGTGGWSITLPAGALVAYDGAGVLELSAAAGAIDTIQVFRTTAGYLFNINTNYTAA